MFTTITFHRVIRAAYGAAEVESGRAPEQGRWGTREQGLGQGRGGSPRWAGPGDTAEDLQQSRQSCWASNLAAQSFHTELSCYPEPGCRHNGPWLMAVAGVCTAEHCPISQLSTDSERGAKEDATTHPHRKSVEPKGLPSPEPWALGFEEGPLPLIPLQ